MPDEATAIAFSFTVLSLNVEISDYFEKFCKAISLVFEKNILDSFLSTLFIIIMYAQIRFTIGLYVVLLLICTSFHICICSSEFSNTKSFLQKTNKLIIIIFRGA